VQDESGLEGSAEGERIAKDQHSFDFILLNAIRDVEGVQGALDQASLAIRNALKPSDGTRAALK